LAARLLKGWALSSVIYVGVAGAFSVEPVRTALAQADSPRPPPLAPDPAAAPTGPLPDAPDTPSVRIAKTVAKQAAITFAPPLLVLWFGWDVWFAVVGFLSPDRKAGRKHSRLRRPPQLEE
jgi:hypothetical protein